MKLSELFRELSYGDLNNLEIGGEGSGTIPDCHQAKLLGMVNRSLSAISGRFLIFEKEVGIRSFLDQTKYPLRKEFAQQDATVGPRKYIQDTTFAPFQGDVVKILKVFDELGEQQVLNQPENCLSFFLPEPDTLQIPYPQEEANYLIIYHGRHPDLVVGENGVVDLNQEVQIPNQLITALHKNIAWRVFSPMNGQEHIARAQEHLQMYDLLSSEIEDKDLLNTSRTIVIQKFNERGWT